MNAYVETAAGLRGAYHRARCDRCGLRGHWHRKEEAARIVADRHRHSAR